MRLDKYLSEMGAASRSEIKDLCRKGRVTVNGIVQKKSDARVEASDIVALDGICIPYEEKQYFLLNKPQGLITATSDRRQKTVMDLLPYPVRKDLFPVGRLDKDTEGLLLITNDGPLANRLLSPKHHAEKTYFARVRGPLAAGEVTARFASGVDIGDSTPTLPAVLKVLTNGEEAEIELTITEGRFHQVKRMFEAVGSEVLFLKRLRMASLRLDPDLEAGTCRRLTEEEIRELLKTD